MRSLQDVVLDANFFISAFGSYPARLGTLGEISKSQGYELHTSNMILGELRRYIQNEVRKHVEVIRVDRREINHLIEGLSLDKKSLPQVPDLSLIAVAKKLDGALIVSSDLKLLEASKLFGVSGLMGSAWLLELFEKETGSMLRRALKIMRDDVWAQEVRYSIERQEIYDPIKRIKLIEEQARKVIEGQVKKASSLRVKAETRKLDLEARREILEREAGFFFDLIQQMRGYFPQFLRELKTERYSELISELDQYVREFEYNLLILSLTAEQKVHQAACLETAIDYLLLNYFSALAYLYRAGEGDIERAAVHIEEANKALLFNTEVSSEVRAMIHFLRIILLLLTENYEQAEFYFSLYHRKCEEWQLADQIEANDGLFTALVALRGYEASPELKNPGCVIDFLIDLGSSFFAEGKHGSVRKILEYSLAFAEWGKLLNQKTATTILQKLYMSLFATNYGFREDYRNLLERMVHLYEESGWDTSQLEMIGLELDNKPLDLRDYIVKKSKPIKEIHPVLGEWMDVLHRKDDENANKSLLIVRNWYAGFNIGISLPFSSLPEDANLGDKVKIVSGDVVVRKAPRGTFKREHLALKVEFAEGKPVQLACHGGQGFRCIATESLGPKE